MTRGLKTDVRPERCKQCGSFHVVKIIFNKLIFSKELKADLAAGTIVRGGFRISLKEPEWKCMDCGSEFYSTAS